VCGSSPTVYFGGSSYFVIFIYNFSKKVWVYVIKRKVDVFNVFKQFRVLVEKGVGREIKCLRKYNGGEFTSLEFEKYCKEYGIKRHKTRIYTPQQNGVAEHMNMTLLERARSMLSSANLQQELWA
jgi:transposase InsO family protein